MWVTSEIQRLGNGVGLEVGEIGVTCCVGRVKTQSEIRFRRAVPAGDWFLVRRTQVYCGFHTVKLSIEVPRTDILWRKTKHFSYRKLDNQGLHLQRPEYWARQKILQNHGITSTKRKKRKAIILSYRYNRLTITFEPYGDFPFEGTDLLPLNQWKAVWPGIAKTISEHLGCPGLFQKYPLTISRFDLAFDVVCQHPSRLIHSMSHLAEDGRIAKIVRLSEHCAKSSSRRNRAGREITRYNRVEKSGGYPIMRMELRCQRPDAVRRGLGYKSAERFDPLELSDEYRLTNYIFKSLRQYGIYGGSMILPIDVARNWIQDPPLLSGLSKFNEWKALNRIRYYTKQMINKECIIIGTVESENVYNIDGLYEALVDAFYNSLDG